MNKYEICFAVVTFLVGVLILLDSYRDKEAPAIDYPPPQIKRVYTPSEATVDVSAYFNGQRSYGKGIIVRRNGQMFVLTSSMILNEDVECIAVETEWTSTAVVLHQNNVWGLVALECHLPANTPFVELNDDPNIPPLVQVVIDGLSASTLKYINDDWVLLGDLPEDRTGCPVVQNDYIVGIVVGMNQINRDQAIMVGNRALKEFCDQATLIDIAPIDPRSPHHAPPVLEVR